jgi:hypothetical protein
MDAFEHHGSGWVLRELLKLTFRAVRFHDWFNNVNGYMELLDWLKGRKSLVNIKNEDDHCFYKCLYRGLVKHKNRNEYRDISMDTVNNYFKEANIDISIFKDGFTPEAYSYSSQRTILVSYMQFRSGFKHFGFMGFLSPNRYF